MANADAAGPSSDDPPDDGPLTGVRVLDLTSVLMGPYATQILGDMGADVIKVESPQGDTTRGIGPMRHPGMGAIFLHANRNKRSICLDLKADAGRDVLLELAKTADVLMYNVRPAAMKRLRLSYDDVRAVNPRIIHVGMFGYGQTGPYADHAAYDDLIQGAMGLPTLIGATGDGTPRYVPIVFVDRAVGIAAVNPVTAALYRRERTGRGQAIEVPMFETMVPLLLGEHMFGHTFVPPLGPMGYPRTLARERRPYQTSDGHVCAVIYTDKHWRSFYRLSGRDDAFAADARLRTISERTKHMSDLCEEVAAIFRTDTTDHWMARLGEADIPCMRLHSPESLMNDPHLAAVGFFERVEHPSEGEMIQMRQPVTTSGGTRVTARRFAPRLGEHTREVLREAGFDETRIDRLVEGRVIHGEVDMSALE